MRQFAGYLCAILLLQSTTLSAGLPQSQQQTTSSANAVVLEDGTPVKLRLAQSVSSADAHVNDRIEFEVLEEVKVGGVLVIPKGGIAWGTVTQAEPKKRMGRGGKLEIVMDSVRLVDGSKAALRATKEAQGGGHTGAMTAGIVVTGLILWPAAPFFLFMHGKDITIAKGTEVPTFVSGNQPLDLAKLNPNVPAQMSAGAPANIEIAVASNPAGADVELDGAFVGGTPSTIGVLAGDHVIVVKKSGYKPWQRNIKVTSGKIAVNADLESQ